VKAFEAGLDRQALGKADVHFHGFRRHRKPAPRPDSTASSPTFFRVLP
jgi:hypothetical protein